MAMRFAPSLRLLADLIAGALGGPPAPAAVIGEAMVALARRHQVSALLRGALAMGHHAISPENLGALEEDYQASLDRRHQALGRLATIGETFSARGISWMAVKGTTQAAQLYHDPAWRFSADLDILVEDRDFAPSLRALEALGFIASYPPLPASALLRRLMLWALRDVTLIAADDHRCAVELHRRLFFARAYCLPRQDGPIPVAKLGPELAFYLIAHGALSQWVRLKWLADLVPLLNMLDDEGRRSLLAIAKAAKAERALAASLLLLHALFPCAVLGSLAPWLAVQAQRVSVQRRFARYAEMLGRADDQRHSPLNDAFVSLQANLMVFDSLPARLLLLLKAPASSLVRRLAALFYPAERSLTLPPSDVVSAPAIQRVTPRKEII